MDGEQIGSYLNQFYKQGPYLHNITNNVPYRAAFFGESFRATRQIRLDMFDAMIASMQANEQKFYDEMNVKNIADFNNTYMLGKDILKYAKQGPKGQPLAASRISGNFFQKVQYLIVVPLRNILTLKIEEKDTNKIIKTVIEENQIMGLLSELVGETAMKALTHDEVINYIGLIMAANLQTFAKKKAIMKPSKYYDIESATQGLVRNRTLKLLQDENEMSRINPIVQEKINDLYIRTILNKAIPIRVKKAKVLLRKQILPIIKRSPKEFGHLSPEQQQEQAEFYIKIISSVIDDWGTKSQYKILFRNTGIMTGSVGEFAVSFSLNVQVNQDPIIKDAAEVEQKIQSVLRSMQPATIRGSGDVVSYTPGQKLTKFANLKYNSANPNSHKYKRYSGQVTQDIIFEGKKGQKYAFSVKNYISEILTQGIQNATLAIRGEKSMNTFMGDVLKSSPRLNLTQDDIKRFVYVLVNNIFRGDNNNDLLNTFMNSLINFYLQDQFIKGLTHTSAKLKQTYGGDIRNSFIVMAGMYLIPMSTILMSVRDNLQLSLNQEYAKMSESSLFSIGAINYPDSGYLYPALYETKREIMAQDGSGSGRYYTWPGAPRYGNKMLALGISAGLSIYKQINMPSMSFKVDQLINVISSAMNSV